MPLQLSECSDSDFLNFFTIVSLGFGTEHEYFNVVFPGHTTPSGRQAGASRLLQIKHTDPAAVFLKVTDTDTDEMIGVAKWNVYRGGVPEEGGLGTSEFWGSEEEAEYADVLFRAYLMERRRAIRESGGKLVALDILSVDPKHHYRGAGRMLVDWGVKVADELDVEAVVEASVYGRHLYETCGFQKVRFVTIEPPERFKHLVKMKQRFFWMVRLRKSVREQKVNRI